MEKIIVIGLQKRNNIVNIICGAMYVGYMLFKDRNSCVSSIPIPAKNQNNANPSGAGMKLMHPRPGINF